LKRLFIISASLFLLHASNAHGQQVCNKPKYLTITYTSGFSTSQISLKKMPCGACYTNGLFLRRYINRHLSIESGVQFSTNYYATPIIKITSNYYQSRTQPITTNIPLAIKYYLGPASKKFNSFIATGCYYSISNKNNPPKDHATAISMHDSFIPFTFMHGVSYKLSNKVEINETIHFTPNDERNCNQIGMDISLGIRL
jgi:hypothetical protein